MRTTLDVLEQKFTLIGINYIKEIIFLGEKNEKD